MIIIHFTSLKEKETNAFELINGRSAPSSVGGVKDKCLVILKKSDY